MLKPLCSPFQPPANRVVLDLSMEIRPTTELLAREPFTCSPQASSSSTSRRQTLTQVTHSAVRLLSARMAVPLLLAPSESRAAREVLGGPKGTISLHALAPLTCSVELQRRGRYRMSKHRIQMQ